MASSTRERLLRWLTLLLLLAAVLLVFAPPIASLLFAQTAGDSSRMAMAGTAAELIGLLVSGLVVSILKKARAQGSSRSPTLALRSALVVARVTFWGSILLAAVLSFAAFFFWSMAFGLSG
jgi:hypothetical protein